MMMRHQVPELLRRVSALSLPVSPPPSRFWRHAYVIDPIAEAYAELYGELYADAGMPPLPGMQMPSPFLHRAEGLPWGISKDLLRRATKVAQIDDRVRAILKPQRFEPDWIYSQA